jgi:hypothetical protein
MENSIEKKIPNEEVTKGIYRHFKGMEVEVIGVALDSETQEKMVVYLHPDPVKGAGANTMWVRPVKMFLEEVDKPEIGYKGPRFIYVREK